MGSIRRVNGCDDILKNFNTKPPRINAKVAMIISIATFAFILGGFVFQKQRLIALTN